MVKNPNPGVDIVNPIKTYFESFGTWYLAMMNMVPISLMVSLEMVKFFQGYFIEQDWRIYDIEKDMHTKA
jgi:hypothetical protein